MPIGDIYEVKLQSRTATQLGLNVRHYRVITSTSPEPPLADIAAQLGAVFGPVYIPLLSTQAQYDLTAVKRIFPLPASLEQASTAGSGVGTATGDLLPKQTSGIITLRSALAGRRNRGRSFIPFPAEDSNTIGATPTPAYFGLLGALAGALVLDRTITVGAGSIVLRPVIWRRAQSNSIDVFSTVPRTVWATQRRRGDYGRPNPPAI